jgi:NADH-quinone oxidoreductase subunit G
VDKVPKEKRLDFGSGVVHDQERCVLCARCVRFCRDITKTGELGIVNRTDYARVAIFPGRPLSNRYALNVVDLCPVGAMTSADFRFSQRVWFLKKGKSICHGCSKGCNIFIDHNREKYKDDIIYRYKPRHNDKVNGYFICDEGRMSYKQENEGRLTEALRKGKTIDFAEGATLAAKAIDQAAQKLILLSPNLSVEQMVAAQAMAKKTGARISGYSDGYIVKGDGDDFLIQDDKSANRAALKMLGIDTTEAAFFEALGQAELLLSVDNDLRGADDKALKKALKNTVIIALSARVSAMTEQAEIALPLASYSEYDGSVVNCDTILQSFEKAVRKNTPQPDAVEVIRRLGGPLGSREEIYAELKKGLGPLANIDFHAIPAEGLQLT